MALHHFREFRRRKRSDSEIDFIEVNSYNRHILINVVRKIRSVISCSLRALNKCWTVEEKTREKLKGNKYECYKFYS